MGSKKDKAIQLFRSGFNCSQSVLGAFSEDMQLNDKIAEGISCAFGGGMGRLQQTCGAVTGAYMVLGLYNAGIFSNNRERKEAVYSMVQAFSGRFNALHGTTDCRLLLGCDMQSEEGREYIKSNNLYETICEKCVADAVEILEELI